MGIFNCNSEIYSYEESEPVLWFVRIRGFGKLGPFVGVLMISSIEYGGLFWGLFF